MPGDRVVEGVPPAGLGRQSSPRRAWAPLLVDGLGPWWPLPIVGAAAGIALVVSGIVVALGGQRRIS